MPDHPVPHPDVAGYVLGLLEPAEAARFGHHLRDCGHCRDEVADLAGLRPLLDQVAPAPAVPPGLAARTMAAVERAAVDAEPEPGQPAPAPEPEPAGPTVRRRRGVLVGALAAAAVAAVAAGASLAGSGDGGGRRIPLVSAGGAATDTVATLRRADQGITVELVVAGLAAPPAGSFYECWYVGEEDSDARPARLSAGTFTLAGTGPTTVRMTTAADPARYPRIEVTLEPDDGDPRRTGPVVLRSVPRSDRSGGD